MKTSKTTLTAVLNLIIVIGSLILFMTNVITAEVLTTMILGGTTAANILIGYLTQDAIKTIDFNDPETMKKIIDGAKDVKEVLETIKKKKN